MAGTETGAAAGWKEEGAAFRLKGLYRIEGVPLCCVRIGPSSPFPPFVLGGAPRVALRPRSLLADPRLGAPRPLLPSLTNSSNDTSSLSMIFLLPESCHADERGRGTREEAKEGDGEEGGCYAAAVARREKKTSQTFAFPQVILAWHECKIRAHMILGHSSPREDGVGGTSEDGRKVCVTYVVSQTRSSGRDSARRLSQPGACEPLLNVDP